MASFEIKNILFEEWMTRDELYAINRSDCDDFLSHLIFNKIKIFAKTTLSSLHNLANENQLNQHFDFISLAPELGFGDKGKSDFREEMTMQIDKLLLSPAAIYQDISIRKTFPERGIIDKADDPVQLLFNPYVLGLTVSHAYFMFRCSEDLHSWCNDPELNLRFSSIEKVADIIEDHFCSEFIDIYNTGNDVLFKLYEDNDLTRREVYEIFTGLEGGFINAFITWNDEFVEDNLLPDIKELCTID